MYDYQQLYTFGGWSDSKKIPSFEGFGATHALQTL
jgi:hypothetical protein